MGCIQSKNESTDLHPNVFRVVNIDENGADLCSGQLEITDTDIILYREGRDSTIWPLHSLRRYGFESEIFSFESGRRCETGEGIYAFRCRRASLLFHTLQQQIQQRNVNQDTAPYPSTPFPVSRLTPNSQGRQTLQATVVHRSSLDNGQPENLRPLLNTNFVNITHSGATRLVPASRSSNGDILEVMRLYSRSEINGTQTTNIYQINDFKREHNNNQNEMTNSSQPDYCNDLNRDLALLRKTLRKDTVLQTKLEIEDETQFLESRYMNDGACEKNTNNIVSPTLSNSSEHYAKLSLEQQESMRLYMNVGMHENNITNTNKNEPLPTTPLTPKQVEYYNITLGNTYANLALGELGTGSGTKQGLTSFALSEHQKFSESDTFTSMSPVEELEVNYAVLDIDINKERKNSKDLNSPEIQSYSSSKNNSVTSNSSQSRSRLLSQCSVEKTPTPSIPAAMPPNTIGYTTIDFDKTVALTSVASGTDVGGDGSRKTRHNSCNVACNSPVTEKNKASYT